ncbi:hypothetical protein BSKO_02692 [Bryopsis sp. KO-2023]|nr:hypothetical protein BSKO_02692 [Bryopsis sp. KO-2023]
MEGTKKGGIFLLGKVTAAIFIIQFKVKVKIKIPREVSSPCCKFLYPLSRQMSSSSKGNGQENHPLAKIIELITKQRSSLRKANEKSSQEGVAAARQLASALDIAGTEGDRGLDLRPDIEDHVPDPGPDAGDGHTPMTDAKDETDAGEPSKSRFKNS